MRIRSLVIMSLIVIISFISFNMLTQASEDQVNLENDLVHWVMDETNQVTYAMTSNGDLHKISHDPLTISETASVGNNPADFYLFNSKIYVSLPDTNSIKVFDATTLEPIETFITENQPHQIVANDQQIIYSDRRLYDLNLTDGTETEIVVGEDSYSSFSDPVLNMDHETNIVYVAEYGTSGADLRSFSAEDYSLASEATYKDGYGFPYPKGNFTIHGNDAFYAGHKINKDNLAEIHGFYADEFSIKNLTGSYVAKIIGADDQYVYSQESVFDRDTFRKVGTIPSNITQVLSDGTIRLTYDSQHKTIQLNTDSYADQTTTTQFQNNKLSLNQNLDQWIFDEDNQRIYAISTNENQLLIINSDTMDVIEKRFIGSAPTDIELLDNTLYIALAGSTKIATLNTATGAEVSYMTTLQNPYDIAVDETKINYATVDQHVTLYHINRTTNEENKMEFYDTNKNTYYEPAIQLDPTNNYLYIGESGSSGSHALVIDSETGELIMKSDYDDGYGFGYPERVILFDDTDIYYAGHRLEKSDVTNEKIELFDDNSEHFVTITDSHIFSNKKIYSKETNQPIYAFPTDITINSAAVDQTGQIYLSVPENDAIYKFASLDELKDRTVENFSLNQHEDESFEFTWDLVTGDGYKLYAKHEALEDFTSVTDAPILTQNFSVTDTQLKQWLGREVTFSLKSLFGNEESSSMNAIQHKFDIPTPVITDYGLKATPEELSDLGEEAFLISFEREELMDGFNVYAYSDDQEINQKFEVQELVDPEIWFAEDQYLQWAGKTINFAVTYEVNGHESEKSEIVTFTFEEMEEEIPEEEEPTDPVNGDLKVPEITYLDFEQTPDELVDRFGDELFKIRFNLNDAAEGYKMYAYSDDGTVEFNHTSDYKGSELWITEKLYSKWDGKIMHFQVSQIIDGEESEKSRVKLYNFGKVPTKDSDDTESDSTSTETEQNDTQDTTQSENESSNNDDTLTGNTSNRDNSTSNTDTEEESTPQVITVKPSKKNDTHIVTDETLVNVKNGDEVNIDLKDDEESNSSVSLTKEQIEYLKENGTRISIERVTTRITLPSSIFEGFENDTTVHINRLENHYGAISDVYDYTINQGDSTISEFSEPVTLTFNVDPNKIQNPNNVKVYYFNEELEEWELIGGTYEDGVVTAETTHFSTYAVFEKEEKEEEQEDNEETSSESSEEQHDDQTEVAAGEPKDASNNESFSTLWWVVIVIFITAGSIIFVRKKLSN